MRPQNDWRSGVAIGLDTMSILGVDLSGTHEIDPPTVFLCELSEAVFLADGFGHRSMTPQSTGYSGAYSLPVCWSAFFRRIAAAAWAAS